MPGVTIEAYGLSFVLECFKRYWGEALWFFAIFLAGLFFSLLQKKKDGSRLFLSLTLFLLITVCNPFLVRLFIQPLGFETVYYRFFWLLPVSAGVAYYLTKLVSLGRNAFVRPFIALACAAFVVWAGSPIAGGIRPSLPDNLYKVSDDLLFACEIIHQDSSEEQPHVVFDLDMNMTARQYDPSLKLSLTRNAVLYRAGSQTVNAMNEESPAYKAQKVLMDVIYYNEPTTLRRFKAALRWRTVDYLVVPLANTQHDFIRSSGCTAIAESENYVIYRNDSFSGAEAERPPK